MKIAILILAAGSSTRMKTAKQLLPVGDTTLLGITIKNALNSEANHSYCILGANSNAISTSISKFEIEIILNSNYKSGLSSSIVTGIQHLLNKNFDAVLILLGDQPNISTSDINTMIATFRKHQNKIIASNYEGTFGVPALIPKDHFKRLLELKGDKGAKDFLNSGNVEVIISETTNLMDIDTKKDYEQYINSTNSE